LVLLLAHLYRSVRIDWPGATTSSSRLLLLLVTWIVLRWLLYHWRRAGLSMCRWLRGGRLLRRRRRSLVLSALQQLGRFLITGQLCSTLPMVEYQYHEAADQQQCKHNSDSDADRLFALEFRKHVFETEFLLCALIGGCSTGRRPSRGTGSSGSHQIRLLSESAVRRKHICCKWIANERGWLKGHFLDKSNRTQSQSNSFKKFI
jgi:hypothetical protein